MSDRTTNKVATWDEIVWHYQQLAGAHKLGESWCGERREWGIPGTCTYINGIVMTIDGDYWTGQVIEVVDDGPDVNVVSFGIVNLYHGAGKTEGTDVVETGDGVWECVPFVEYDFKHDSMQYQPHCGSFFERTDAADYVTVCQWAVSRIYGMADEFFRRK